ncbi:MAG: ABC transporter permease subunit [Desulfobacterales bacterium]|jgi:general L-amino acid transport system permease protein
MAGKSRRPPPKRPPITPGALWHSAGFRGIIYQVLLVVLVIGTFIYLFSNAQTAMEKRGISTGFDFLEQESGFAIGEGLLPSSPEDTYLRAFGIAILNTLKVSAVSVVFATIIGTLVGLGRLSSNWVIKRIASIYVELFRNTPQLVQIIFWYTLVTRLPSPRRAFNPIAGVFLCNRGFIMPWPVGNSIHIWMAAGFIAGCAGTYALGRWARSHWKRTGRYVPVFWYGLGMIIGIPAVIWFLGGAPLDMEVPRLSGFNFVGGVSLSPEFLGLAIGLSLYIASFIAEIVRSGIQSVEKGQIEAARAIGLRPGFIFRMVVFPQALRVMIPPAAAQYVSLVKNSSLGVAIGYPELFNVNNTITTLSGNTMECIGIMMAVYLAISFTIALIMNWYNRLVQIKER